MASKQAFSCDMNKAHTACLVALAELRSNHLFAKDYIRSSTCFSALAPREKAYATRLLSGLVLARPYIDTLLARYIKRFSHLTYAVQDILACAVFEVLFLKHPAHAVIADAVSRVSRVKRPLSGLCNASLRALARVELPRTQAAYEYMLKVYNDGEAICADGGCAADAAGADDGCTADASCIEAASACAAMPVSIARRIYADRGAHALAGQALALVDALPLFACVNQGLEHHPAPAVSASSVRLPGDTSLARQHVLPYALVSEAQFGIALVKDRAQASRFSFQHPDMLMFSDFAAQAIAALAVWELAHDANSTPDLLEIACGRGTKSLLMASFFAGLAQANTQVNMQAHAQANTFASADASFSQANARPRDFHHLAFDSDAHKVQDARSRMRAWAPWHDFSADAVDCRALDTSLPAHTMFDHVFVDAPCSGISTVRRHVDTFAHLDLNCLDPRRKDSLPCLQLSLLKEASRYVKPGGKLIYSTCSLFLAEDEDIIDAFLHAPEGARFCARELPGSWKEWVSASCRQFARDLISEASPLRQTLPQVFEDVLGKSSFEFVFPSCPAAFDAHFVAYLEAKS